MNNQTDNLEVIKLKNKIDASLMPDGLREKCLRMLERLQRMSLGSGYSQEYEVIEKYINTVTQIPFGKMTTDIVELKAVKDELDATHFGLEPVKDRILEFISVLNLQINRGYNLTGINSVKQNNQTEFSKMASNSAHAPILCFVGVQGIGKTSIGKSIANAVGRKLIRVSMGAMGNVTQIRGVSRANLDAEPGQIIKSLIRTGVMNPLILLDEIDKTSGDETKRYDFMAALLEILDPEQNGTFIDHYLDYPIDLSAVMFICTANTLGTLSAALLDRLEIIRFNSYNDAEKAAIAKNYLLPKVRLATGITEQELSFSEDIWTLIIRPLGFDAGIRQLERNLTNLARKVAKEIVEGKVTSVKITPENFRHYIPDDIGVYS